MIEKKSEVSIMGSYFNPGNSKFKEMIQRQIYVDKSLFIEYTNKVIHTKDKYICICKPSGFGKSTDAQMLCAYYDSGCDSNNLFKKLKIAGIASYQKHLNQHHVIFLNIQDFLSVSHSIEEVISLMEKRIIQELKLEYPQYVNETIISFVLEDIFAYTKDTFIFIVDEWDCIFRVYQKDSESQKKYLDFLRNLFKDRSYASLVYMTGILPIKKYGTHSALNMFDEISMLDSAPLSSFMGFTQSEVLTICDNYHMNFNDMKAWYDGYHVTKDISIYSPRSVVKAALKQEFGNYWTQTESYEALKMYIEKNVDGLKDSIIELLAGKNVKINVDTFENDMTTINKKDDVFTLLVHLGYLGYDRSDKFVHIPNTEVRSSFIAATESSKYQSMNEVLD